ncbi:LolA family protein [Brassicibacter mesophilus]|uniref:LolA family protein n=1 Tax=Brassicibacter mesophilus TaxID=745119 RepID=UPI003D244C04
MKKSLVGLFFIIIVFLIQGCSKPTDEEIYYEMQKTISNIESYRCIADVKVIGNKAPSSYKAKHIFTNPNKYVIEILEPEENKGNITLYDGNQAWMYSSHVGESFLLKDYQQAKEEYLFIGYFLRNFITTEKAQVSFDKIEDKEFIVLTTEIPGNHKYRKYEKLWINKLGFIPYKLVVFDNNNNVSVEVIYSEFKYDVDLPDDQFNIRTGIDIIKGL